MSETEIILTNFKSIYLNNLNQHLVVSLYGIIVNMQFFNLKHFEMLVTVSWCSLKHWGRKYVYVQNEGWHLVLINILVTMFSLPLKRLRTYVLNLRCISLFCQIKYNFIELRENIAWQLCSTVCINNFYIIQVIVIFDLGLSKTNTLQFFCPIRQFWAVKYY